MIDTFRHTVSPTRCLDCWWHTSTRLRVLFKIKALASLGRWRGIDSLWERIALQRKYCCVVYVPCVCLLGRLIFCWPLAEDNEVLFVLLSCCNFLAGHFLMSCPKLMLNEETQTLYSSLLGPRGDLSLKLQVRHVLWLRFTAVTTLHRTSACRLTVSHTVSSIRSVSAFSIASW